MFSVFEMLQIEKEQINYLNCLILNCENLVRMHEDGYGHIVL